MHSIYNHIYFIFPADEDIVDDEGLDVIFTGRGPLNNDRARCLTDYVECGNSQLNETARCISKYWMCDGDDDCRDGSDEVVQDCG